MNEQQRKELAAYIADYIAEEFERGNIHVDKRMVLDAINLFMGAVKSMRYVVRNHNHTLLGEFDNEQDAQKEAAFYMDMTGNIAAVFRKEVQA